MVYQARRSLPSTASEVDTDIRSMGLAPAPGGKDHACVGQAILFGVISSGALVIGGAIGAYWRAPERVTGVLLAFASGLMISALSFELFQEAYDLGGVTRAGIGLIAGAGTFVVVNAVVDSRVAAPEEDQRDKVEQGARGGVGFALLAAVVLDGAPENLALGVSLVEEASVTLLVAIAAANIPEALVGAGAMRDAGRSPRSVITLWALTAALLAPAVLVGRVALGGVGEETLSIVLAFAGGAVLAALADTLMPEAFEHGRPWNSFATAGGFVLAFVLAG
jgi:ZIP family zinc transporter